MLTCSTAWSVRSSPSSNPTLTKRPPLPPASSSTRWTKPQFGTKFPLFLNGPALHITRSSKHKPYSLYFWRINSTIASVVLGATSFGAIFYLFILLAATTSVSCRYQTPGSRSLRSTASVVLAAVSSCGRVIERSRTAIMLRLNMEYYQPLRSRNQIKSFSKDILYETPSALAVDTFRLLRAAPWPLVARFLGAYAWLLGTIFKGSGQVPDGKTTVLDSQCISWILRTSPYKGVHQVTLKYFTTIITLEGLDPTLVADCFNVLIGCVKVVDSDIVITPELEHFAVVSAVGLLCSHGSGRNFPCLRSSPPAVHKGFSARGSLQQTRIFLCLWRDPLLVPSIPEVLVGSPEGFYTILSRICPGHTCAHRAGPIKYRRKEDSRKKVPRWILSFAMQRLSSPHLPTSATDDCLSVTAIEFGNHIFRCEVRPCFIDVDPPLTQK